MLFQNLGLFEVFFLSMVIGSGLLAFVALGSKFVKDTSNNKTQFKPVLTDFNRNQLKEGMARRNR